MGSLIWAYLRKKPYRRPIKEPLKEPQALKPPNSLMEPFRGFRVWRSDFNFGRQFVPGRLTDIFVRCWAAFSDLWVSVLRPRHSNLCNDV